MTVKKLRQLLREFGPNLEVRIVGRCNCCVSHYVETTLQEQHISIELDDDDQRRVGLLFDGGEL